MLSQYCHIPQEAVTAAQFNKHHRKEAHFHFSFILFLGDATFTLFEGYPNDKWEIMEMENGK